MPVKIQWAKLFYLVCTIYNQYVSLHQESSDEKQFLNFDAHTFLMFMLTNDYYSSNFYKSLEIVFNFDSSIVSSATKCALFESKICIHITSEFDITADFFFKYTGVDKSFRSVRIFGKYKNLP